MTDTKKIARLKVGGETLALAFTTNAQVEYEDEMSCDFSSVSDFFANASNRDAAGRAKPVKLSIRTMRALLWAALKGGDEAGKGVSMKRAGEIVDEAGYESVMLALSEALALAFGQGGDESKGKAKAAPKDAEKAQETPVSAS
ncbi:hypothetical protein [Celeribacter ethanolicus]|uniref:hypothetical protein n=1 Tax=Celeribacter ethanolicus TaxID=1758178 RepID=UPI0008325CA8|nr:hypothetical protein [Celeribacter ethanolicus]